MELKPEQEIFLMTLTVAMEAEGETYEGKLAVAWAIRNRADYNRKSIMATILSPHAFTVWSSIGGRRHMLESMSEQVMKDSHDAAFSAYYRHSPDLSNGATHFINEDATRRLREGSLPWWTTRLVRIKKIGEHTFYKEKN